MQDNHRQMLGNVRSIIERDTHACLKLAEFLNEEREALKQRDAGALNAAVARKIEYLKVLEKHDQERKLLLRRSRSLDWPTLIATLDPESDRGIANAWHDLQRILREVAELNEINAKIVSRTRRSTERLLALLRGQTEPAGVYDRSGRTHACGDNRAITSA